MYRSKYGNKKIDIDGITFDSQLEGRRYKELKILLKAKKIEKLEIHPKFQLLEDFYYLNKKMRGIWYEADFKYEDKEIAKRTFTLGIVEDCKGMKTKDYLLKKKLFQAKYGYFLFRELTSNDVDI